MRVNAMKTVHALLIFSVLAVALAQGYYQRPLHLDVLESLRQAQHLQQTGLPVDNANALVGNSHYPPIFSILLTEWSALDRKSVV